MQHFSDPVLSLIQSSVESQLRKQLAGEGIDEANDVLARHPTMQGLTQICADLRRGQDPRTGSFQLENKANTLNSSESEFGCLDMYSRMAIYRLFGKKSQYAALRQEFEFSKCDPKWIEAVEAYFVHFDAGLTREHIPYVAYSAMTDFVISGLPNKLTIGILGDWGTGENVAIEMIKKVVAKQPDLIIHLGDVYYAGTEEEYDHKFINLVKEYALDWEGNPIPFLNMPGNHDMYAGGHAYYKAFERLREHNNGGRLSNIEQHASYFCLRNKNESWQLIAMDTAYHDHDPFRVNSGMTRIRKKELEWVIDKVRGFAGRTILLSHHQPFSPHEELGSMTHKKPSDYYMNPNLTEAYRAICAASPRAIPLWIWGHEHNLGIYQPFAGIERGRCVGHSAVPVLSDAAPNAIRHLNWREVLNSFLGFFTGKWGRKIYRESAALSQLMFAKSRFATPVLVNKNNEPVMLSKTRDHDMYRQGFAVMQFTEKGQVSDVSVDYYDDVDSEPLFSETIAASDEAY